MIRLRMRRLDESIELKRVEQDAYHHAIKDMNEAYKEVRKTNLSILLCWWHVAGPSPPDAPMRPR